MASAHELLAAVVEAAGVATSPAPPAAALLRATSTLQAARSHPLAATVALHALGDFLRHDDASAVSEMLSMWAFDVLALQPSASAALSAALGCISQSTRARRLPHPLISKLALLLRSAMLAGADSGALPSLVAVITTRPSCAFCLLHAAMLATCDLLTDAKSSESIHALPQGQRAAALGGVLAFCRTHVLPCVMAAILASAAALATSPSHHAALEMHHAALVAGLDREAGAMYGAVMAALQASSRDAATARSLLTAAMQLQGVLTSEVAQAKDEALLACAGVVRGRDVDPRAPLPCVLSSLCTPSLGTAVWQSIMDAAAALPPRVDDDAHVALLVSSTALMNSHACPPHRAPAGDFISVVTPVLFLEAVQSYVLAMEAVLPTILKACKAASATCTRMLPHVEGVITTLSSMLAYPSLRVRCELLQLLSAIMPFCIALPSLGSIIFTSGFVRMATDACVQSYGAARGELLAHIQRHSSRTSAATVAALLPAPPAPDAVFSADFGGEDAPSYADTLHTTRMHVKRCMSSLFLQSQYPSGDTLACSALHDMIRQLRVAASSPTDALLAGVHMTVCSSIVRALDAFTVVVDAALSASAKRASLSVAQSETMRELLTLIVATDASSPTPTSLLDMCTRCASPWLCSRLCMLLRAASTALAKVCSDALPRILDFLLTVVATPGRDPSCMLTAAGAPPVYIYHLDSLAVQRQRACSALVGVCRDVPATILYPILSPLVDRIAAVLQLQQQHVGAGVADAADIASLYEALVMLSNGIAATDANAAVNLMLQVMQAVFASWEAPNAAGGGAAALSAVVSSAAALQAFLLGTEESAHDAASILARAHALLHPCRLLSCVFRRARPSAALSASHLLRASQLAHACISSMQLLWQPGATHSGSGVATHVCAGMLACSREEMQQLVNLCGAAAANDDDDDAPHSFSSSGASVYAALPGVRGFISFVLQASDAVAYEDMSLVHARMMWLSCSTLSACINFDAGTRALPVVLLDVFLSARMACTPLRQQRQLLQQLLLPCMNIAVAHDDAGERAPLAALTQSLHELLQRLIRCMDASGEDCAADVGAGDNRAYTTFGGLPPGFPMAHAAASVMCQRVCVDMIETLAGVLTGASARTLWMDPSPGMTSTLMLLTTSCVRIASITLVRRVCTLLQPFMALLPPAPPAARLAWLPTLTALFREAVTALCMGVSHVVACEGELLILLADMYLALTHGLHSGSGAASGHTGVHTELRDFLISTPGSGGEPGVASMDSAIQRAHARISTAAAGSVARGVARSQLQSLLQSIAAVACPEGVDGREAGGRVRAAARATKRAAARPEHAGDRDPTMNDDDDLTSTDAGGDGGVGAAAVDADGALSMLGSLFEGTPHAMV